MQPRLILTLLPYALLLVSMILFLGLSFGLSQRVNRLRSRMAKCEERIKTEAAEFAQGVQALNRRVDALVMEIPNSEPPTVSSTGVNGTLRGKALKMHRLGQSTDRISEALRVPKGEVDLLVKVHRMVMRPYENASITAGADQTS